jgi:hypothetical protein
MMPFAWPGPQRAEKYATRNTLKNIQQPTTKKVRWFLRERT